MSVSTKPSAVWSASVGNGELDKNSESEGEVLHKTLPVHKKFVQLASRGRNSKGI